MSWFKVDDKLPTSQKLLRIPRRYRLASLGLWTLAGAWSAGQETDGLIPDHMIEEWGGTSTLVDWLVTSGLWVVAPEGKQFRNWAEYQPTRAEKEAEREKNREKLRKWRSGNRITESAVTELPLGIKPERNLAPVPSPPVPSLKERGKTARAVTLPAAFQVTEDMQAWARTKAPGIDLEHETEKFRNYHQAKGTTFKDWAAAWRNWMTKAVEYANNNPAAAAGGKKEWW